MRLVLFPLCLGLLASCKSESAAPPAANSNTTVTTNTTKVTSEPPSTTESPAPATHPVDAAAMAITARGLNSFTVALYNKTPKEKNTLLSPLSVAAALSLVELGAKGDAAAALHKTLGAKSAEQHRRGLQSLVQTISGDGKPIDQHGEKIHPHKLRIGNSLWVAEGYKLNDAFLEAAKSTYQAIASPMDVSDPKASAGKINDWVMAATADKIKDLVGPGDIDELTRMILVNAVHFLGRWKEPFMEMNTADKPFFVNGKDKSVDVPTMVTSYYFQALDNSDVMIAEMPYWSTSDDNEMVMTLVVPKKRDGLAALEAKLSVELLDSWLTNLKAEARVAIHLPKWKAESTAELSDTLSELGLKPLLAADADLSGISAEEGLQLSAIMHKTYISVDEKGTEAAAATAIMMAGSAPSKPIDLIADHPFLYLIRDTKTGTILFIGRVVDPS